MFAEITPQEMDARAIKGDVFKKAMLRKEGFRKIFDQVSYRLFQEQFDKLYCLYFHDNDRRDLFFDDKYAFFTVHILANPQLHFLLNPKSAEKEFEPIFISLLKRDLLDETFYENNTGLKTIGWLSEFSTVSKAISLVESIFVWPIENYKHFVFLLDELPKLRDEETGENVFWKNLIFLIENSPHLALGAMEKLSDPRWTLLTIQIILNPCLHRFLEKDFNAHPLTLEEVYEAADYENDPTGARVLWLKIIVALNDLNAFKTWVGFNEEMYQDCHSRGMTYTPGRMTETEAAMIESVYTHDRQGAGLPITSDMLALLYKVMPTDQFLERLQKIYDKDFLVQKTFHFIDLLREAVEKNQRNLTPVFALLTASYIADFYRTHLQALITKQKELVKQDDEAGVVKLEEEEAEVIKLKFFAPLREAAQDGSSSSRLSRV